MQLNTDSITVERVEQPAPAPTRKPDPAGLIGAVVIASLFLLWLRFDFMRERQWMAERKNRMEHFRIEARRRHDELVNLQFRERLAAHVTRVIPPATAPIKTPVEATPKQRKIFKLYG
jgi:hypothetical protein